jgi:2-(1,2-epoxy-1,2-dihydrophenyl)acetyl-CoA isomerase
VTLPKNPEDTHMPTNLDVEHDNDVAIIRLNDPATLNALTMDLVDTLHDAVRHAATSARALLLCGAGRSFCSGANLTASGPSNSGPRDAGAALEHHINPLMLTLRDLPIPWISAVQGAAAGVGASLALAADIIIAGENAYFLQAFRRIGLIPDGGATWLLTQAVGRVRAMELMLLGEKLPADKARAWGLINRVVPDAELQSTALAMATDLAAGPTRALGLIRRAAWTAASSDLDHALHTERTLQTEAGHTADFAEGVRAFFEKRPARFTGA